jgi:hypothetical protein
MDGRDFDGRTIHVSLSQPRSGPPSGRYDDRGSDRRRGGYGGGGHRDDYRERRGYDGGGGRDRRDYG